MTLDVPTTMFSTLTVAVILSLYFWALSRKNHPWIRYWALANSSLTLGLFCFTTAGTWTPWVSMDLANLFILGGYLLLGAGARRFAGVGFSRWFPWVYFGIIAICFPLFTFIWPSYEVRTWVHTFLAILVFVRIILLLTTKMPEIRNRHRLMVGAFSASLGAMAVYYLFHAILIMGLGLHSNMDQNQYTAGIFLISQGMLLLCTLGFSSLDHFRTQHELQVTLSNRDRLFSLIAHDLRGPVGNVAVMLQSMVEDGVDTEDLEVSLAVTARAAEDSFRLLENLLDWARTQRGGVQVDIKALDTGELLASVIKPLRPLADAKGQKIRTDIPPGFLLKGDSGTLSAVFRNLVSNAIKFSPLQSEIVIQARVDGAWAAVEILDHGPGIPPGIAKILDQGALPESTRGTGGERGTGLGLSLCREFLKLNLGTLGFEGGTGGTRVTARVPLG